MRDHTRARTAGVFAALFVGALCVACSDDEGVSLEMRIVEDTASESLIKMDMTVWNGQMSFYAHPEVLLTEEDVLVATVTERDGGPAIVLSLSGEGQEKLRRATRQNIGHRLGIIIDGKLMCARVIEAPVESGPVIVTGHMLESTAQRCSRALTRRMI